MIWFTATMLPRAGRARSTYFSFQKTDLRFKRQFFSPKKRRVALDIFRAQSAGFMFRMLTLLWLLLTLHLQSGEGFSTALSISACKGLAQQRCCSIQCLSFCLSPSRQFRLSEKRLPVCVTTCVRCVIVRCNLQAHAIHFESNIGDEHASKLRWFAL